MALKKYTPANNITSKRAPPVFFVFFARAFFSVFFETTGSVAAGPNPSPCVLCCVLCSVAYCAASARRSGGELIVDFGRDD